VEDEEQVPTGPPLLVVRVEGPISTGREHQARPDREIQVGGAVLMVDGQVVVVVEPLALALAPQVIM
jgi:hypothetical protein